MQRHLYSIPDIHSSMPRMPTCLTCNQGDDQPLEHHIHRPRHSFLSSEYLDTDQIVRGGQPRVAAGFNLDDAPMFVAAATAENEDGRPLQTGSEDNELLTTKLATQSTKDYSNFQNIQRNCTFHDAKFSIFSDYYILECLGKMHFIISIA